MISCIDELFTKYDKKVYPDTSIKIDSNKQNYFTLIYLSDSNSKDYDPSINYESELQKEIDKKIEYFKTAYANFNSMNKNEKLALISEMNRYWYFFDQNENSFNKKLDFQPNELAQEIYMNDFFINERFNLGLFYHTEVLHFKGEKSTHISKVYIPTGSTPGFKGHQIDSTVNIKIDNSNSFNFLVGYRLLLKKEYAPFSFIDFKLGFAFNKIELDPSYIVLYELHGVRTNPIQRIDAKVYFDGKSSSSYSLLSKVLFPVYYFNRFLHINIGASYEIRLSNFSYDLITDEKVTDYSNNITSESHSKETRKFSDIQDNLPQGIVSLNVEFQKYEMYIEGSISNKIRLGLGLFFNF